MLLGDADVERAVRKLFENFVDAGPVGHRGGERDDPAVASISSHIVRPKTSVYVGGADLARFVGQPRGRIERARSRDMRSSSFRIRESFALCGQGVDDHGPVIDLFRFLKGADQHRHVVAVDIADVFEAKLVDQRTGQNGRRDRVLKRLRGAPERSADTGNAFKGVADTFFQMLVALSFFNSIQVTAQRA